MEKRPYSDRQWNYFNFLKNNDDSNLFFFTNDVCESLNRTINSFYKFSRKTFMNFSLCIKKIISYYENHIDYIEKNISITRILAWYCKCNNINDLLNNKDIKNIIKQYKIHFQYEMEEEDVVDIDDSDHDIYRVVSLSSSITSSNYYSDSSDKNPEIIII